MSLYSRHPQTVASLQRAYYITENPRPHKSFLLLKQYSFSQGRHEEFVQLFIDCFDCDGFLFPSGFDI